MQGLYAEKIEKLMREIKENINSRNLEMLRCEFFSTWFRNSIKP